MNEDRQVRQIFGRLHLMDDDCCLTGNAICCHVGNKWICRYNCIAM